MKKKDLLKNIGTEFFSAIFTKKNGEERKILAKLHVKDQKFFDFINGNSFLETYITSFFFDLIK